MRACKLAASALCAITLAISSIPARTADRGPSDEWRFSITPYLWVPAIDIETASGSEVEISMDDLLDNLKMAALGYFEARRSRWSFAVDGIYLNLAVDGGGTLSGPRIGGSFDADVDTRSWIWTLTGGYRVWQSDRGTLDVIAGARYLDVSLDLDASKQIGPIGGVREESADGSNINAIVGVRGDVYLDGRWYALYHLDVGTGEIDLTWQAAAGVGYQFNWGDLSLLYRHMEWGFGSGEDLDNIKAGGPMLAATFHF